MPVAGSLVYASTGHPSRHVGSRQWLHPIDKYERDVVGNQPPSISWTRRQLIDDGLPFCSLHATTQHLQPMHFPMSTWKRYCSPAPGVRNGMRPSARGSTRARTDAPLRVSAKVTPSSFTRVNSGRVDILLWRLSASPLQPSCVSASRRAERHHSRVGSSSWSA